MCDLTKNSENILKLVLADKDIPIMCDWNTFENSPGTYYNTPPVWCIYMTSLNVSYMNQMGGLDHFERMAIAKSTMLYDFLDSTNGYYVNRTQKEYRSKCNANFRIEKNRQLEEKLKKEAALVKVVNINGHPANPGIRICMYNAMPFEGVAVLIKFLQKFMKENPL